jgi:predicted dehydrogenase
MHIRAIRQSGKAEIVGLCDMDEARARALADRFDVSDTYDDLGVFLSEKQPDVIHITTPPGTHAALAIQALEAGSHVMVEKPMCLSVSEANDMIAAAERSGAKLCVDHNYLFRPSVQKARSLVTAGDVGQVVYVDAYYNYGREGSYGGEGRSHWAWQLPGGVFTNFLPHVLYLQMEFLGRVDSVAGIAATGGNDAPDGFEPDVSILLQSANGMGMNAITLQIQPYAKFLNIYGTKGIVHVDLANEICTAHKERGRSRAFSKVLFPLEDSAQLALATASNAVQVLAKKLKSYPGLYVLTAEFYQSLQQDRQPPVSGQDGREVVRVLEMIRAKARSEEIRSLQ